MEQRQITIPKNLQSRIESKAKQKQLSFDRYVLYALESQLARDYLLIPVSDEERDKHEQAYDALLKKYPNPTDEEVESALLARDLAKPEKGLTPEKIARVKHKIAMAKAKQGTHQQKHFNE